MADLLAKSDFTWRGVSVRRNDIIKKQFSPEDIGILKASGWIAETREGEILVDNPEPEPVHKEKKETPAESKSVSNLIVGTNRPKGE